DLEVSIDELAPYIVLEDEQDGSTFKTIGKIDEGNNGENKAQKDVLIYPNPANSLLNILLGDSYEIIKPTSIVLYDLFGRKLNTFTITDKYLQMPVDNLPTGNYILEITQEGKTEKHRFTKK